MALPAELVLHICTQILNFCDEFILHVMLLEDGAYIATYQLALSELHEEVLMTHQELYVRLSELASRHIPVENMRHFYRSVRQIIIELPPHSPYSPDYALPCPLLRASMQILNLDWFAFQPQVFTVAGLKCATPTTIVTFYYTADRTGAVQKSIYTPWSICPADWNRLDRDFGNEPRLAYKFARVSFSGLLSNAMRNRADEIGDAEADAENKCAEKAALVRCKSFLEYFLTAVPAVRGEPTMIAKLHILTF